MEEKPIVEKSGEIPAELKKYTEIQGVFYGNLELEKINKIILDLENKLKQKFKESGEQIKLNSVLSRLETFKEYFSYPLYFKDIFDNDHKKRREWKIKTFKKGQSDTKIYEKQRIKQAERQRFTDLEYLLMILSFDYPEIGQTLRNATRYASEMFDNEKYANLSTERKIKYVESFDKKIFFFLKEINKIIK